MNISNYTSAIRQRMLNNHIEHLTKAFLLVLYKILLSKIMPLCFIISSLFIFVTLLPKQASAETIIQDDANIFSDSAKTEYKTICDNIYKTYDTSIYIWTDNNISGSDNYSYMMEQYVEEHPAANNNIVILLIGMQPNDRIYEVQGYGTAQNTVNNSRAEKLLDDMYSDMKNGNYDDAVMIFCKHTESYMKKNPKFDSIVFNSLLQLAVCFIIAASVIGCTAYNSGGRMTTNSHTYLDNANSGIIGSFDRYTHTTTTRTPKPRDNDSHSGGGGGGGGSSHSSGGGRSF